MDSLKPCHFLELNLQPPDDQDLGDSSFNTSLSPHSLGAAEVFTDNTPITTHIPNMVFTRVGRPMVKPGRFRNHNFVRYKGVFTL